MQDHVDYDVAIIGGGPAGSTCGTILRKYNPELRVLIVEKEKFPRDHVGESQLPGVCTVLDEMGAWDKVEAAGFPIKIGASYTWGANNDSWDFDFVPSDQWNDDPRPSKYEGQRRSTAFQVDRAIYDDILLRHAEELGCEVREEVKVAKVLSEGDRITGLELQPGGTVTAKHYVDASGTVALIRRAMKVEGWEPEELKNIAVWDYWQNADWAVEIGSGATRVQVRSLPYGWMWFIPLGPTRTSIGLITPASYYKETGKTPEELYKCALIDQPQIAELSRNATPEGPIRTAKDWSNVADRLLGENWFMTGESCGFADPILAAGLNIAQSSARDLAYTILELDREEIDRKWLLERYDTRHRANIRQHIRFGQYWYAANSCFSDLKAHCQDIAREAGLKLAPEKAWQWISQGGFINELPGHASIGSFSLSLAKHLVGKFDTSGRSVSSKLKDNNIFRLKIDGVTPAWIGHAENGRIKRLPALQRDSVILPQVGPTELVVNALRTGSDLQTIANALNAQIAKLGMTDADANGLLINCVATLDGLIDEGWVEARYDPKKPKIESLPSLDTIIRPTDPNETCLGVTD